MIFNEHTKNDDDDSIWLPVSDLMSVLMLIFLIILMTLLIRNINSTDEVEKLRNNLANCKNIISTALIEKFNEDFKYLGENKVKLVQDELLIKFINFDRWLFDEQKFDPNPEFKDFLIDRFYPKLISHFSNEITENIKNLGCEIKKINIDGHSSSEWGKDTSPDLAFINNMNLSQQRAKSVLSLAIFNINSFSEDEKLWIQKRITANGLSSANLEYIDEAKTIEDKVKSRRVEFKIVLNTDEFLNEIDKKVRELKNTVKR